MVSCLRWLTQAIATALRFARDKAGKSIAAKIAIMAITTSSSIRVNADFLRNPAAVPHMMLSYIREAAAPQGECDYCYSVIHPYLPLRQSRIPRQMPTELRQCNIAAKIAI